MLHSLKPSGRPKEQIRQRALQAMALERATIKGMGNVALLREVALPRDLFQLDRDIGRFRRLAEPPWELRRPKLASASER